MRFVILTQYYPPETGAPQARLSDLAKRLRDLGHEVVVLTAKPNYPKGEFLPGYGRGLWTTRTKDGVEVIHCWLVPVKSKRIVPRLVNYFSFVFAAALAGLLRLRRSDVILVESPPIFLGLTAWWLAKWKRARVIFNVSDLYPETAISLGYLSNPLFQRVLYRFEAWCYRVSALVTGQTAGIVENIRARFPNKRVHLLTNGVDPSDFVASTAVGAEVMLVGYAGVLGHAQELDVVLDAAALLREESSIRFVFYGDGPLGEDLRAKAASLQLTNVEFGGHRSRAEVLQAMRNWSAGIVPLKNVPLFAGALPSKMFEVMGAALPVVLFAPRGEASQIVEQAGGGVWAPAGDPQALANELRRLAADPELRRRLAASAREYVVQHFDRRKIAKEFAAVVEQVVRSS
jgi:glycosyltransferase involved in cell wall biosynthesis